MKNKKQLVKFIEKEWQKHKKAGDPDGFLDCPIEDNWQMRVAPREDWRGDTKSWKEAMREQNEKDKKVNINWCSQCKFFKKLLEMIEDV